jgi:hypothetical protein
MWEGGEGGGLRVPTSDPHTINACWFLFLSFAYLLVAEAASFDKKELCRSDTYVIFARRKKFVFAESFKSPNHKRDGAANPQSVTFAEGPQIDQIFLESANLRIFGSYLRTTHLYPIAIRLTKLYRTKSIYFTRFLFCICNKFSLFFSVDLLLSASEFPNSYIVSDGGGGGGVYGVV